MSNIAPLSPLRRAYQLLQEGNKDGAKKLITVVLKTSPDNANAWYLASYLTDSPDKKLQALRRALKIDPQHSQALLALAKLRGNDPLDELLSNEFSSASGSMRAERTVASMKSYTNAAVIVLVLYFVLWLPGVIANFMYIEEANRMEKLAGHALPGVGALRLERIVFELLPLLGVLVVGILLLLGTAALWTTKLR